MSELGLGRIKTALAMSPLAVGSVVSQAMIAAISCLLPAMFIARGRLIGENQERDIGGCFGSVFEEVRRPHVGFHRAVDRLAPLPHGCGVVVEAPLHFFSPNAHASRQNLEIRRGRRETVF